MFRLLGPVFSCGTSVEMDYVPDGGHRRCCGTRFMEEANIGFVSHSSVGNDCSVPGCVFLLVSASV